MIDKFELKSCDYENVKELYWIKNDTGAWTGPLSDWIENKIDFMMHVKSFNTVLQAGGCCGMYPRFYKNYFKEVITFEPNKDNYECLVKNCENIDGIIYYNSALGDSISTARMLYAKPGGDSINIGMHKIDHDSPGEITVTTIDNLKLKNLDLIHLDLEGSEENAIIGGIQTITRYWPIIITERSNGSDILEVLGYECVKTLKMDSIFVKRWW